MSDELAPWEQPDGGVAVAAPPSTDPPAPWEAPSDPAPWETPNAYDPNTDRFTDPIAQKRFSELSLRRFTKGPSSLSPAEQKELQGLTAKVPTGLEGTLLDPANANLGDPTLSARLGISGINSEISAGKINFGAIPAHLVSTLVNNLNTAISSEEDAAKDPEIQKLTQEGNSPVVQLPKPAGNSILAGVVRGLETSAEGLTTPQNLEILAGTVAAPAIVQKTVAAAFAAQMSHDVPEKIQEIRDSKDAGEAAQRVTELLAQAAMIFGGTKHAFARDATLPEGEVRPPSLSPEDANRAATQNQIRTLAGPQTPLTKNAPYVAPGVLDGLNTARQVLVDRQKAGSPGEADRYQQSIDEIDDQLLRADKDAAQASAERVAARRSQTPPPAEEVPPVTTGSPPAKGGTSSLFKQAQAEAGGTPEPPAAEPAPPSEPADKIEDPAMHQAALDSAERIATQVTQGQGDIVQRAARDAAYDKIKKNMDAGQPTMSFVRETAKAAAGDAVKKAGVSLDAEKIEGQTIGDTMASEEPTPAQAAAKADMIDAVQKQVETLPAGIQKTAKAFLEAAQNGESTSLRDLGEKLGVSQQTVANHLKAMRDSFKGLKEEGYSVGPGAASISEQINNTIQPTSLKRAVVDVQREAEGREGIDVPARAGSAQLVSDADDRLTADPEAGKTLVDKILSKKVSDQQVSPTDAATMLVERARLRNERAAWEERAADPHSSEEERADAKDKLSSIYDQIDRIDQASRMAGTAWSDFGRLYQQVIKDDYSLEALERKAIASKGEPMSRGDFKDAFPEEHAKLVEQAKKISDLEKQTEAARNDYEDAETQHFVEATINELGKSYLEKPAFGKKVFDIARGIVDRWKEEAKTAHDDLLKALGSANAGIPNPAIVLHVAKILRAKIGEFGLDKTEAFAEMVQEYGPKVQEHLEKGWKQAKALIAGEKGDSKAKEIAAKGASKKGEKTPAEAKAEAKAEKVAGQKLSQKTIVDHVRALINAGEHDTNKLMAKTTEAMKEHFPDVTDRDVRRAFVDYNKDAVFPNPNVVEKEIRENKQIVKIQEDIDREMEGQRGIVDPETGELLGAKKLGYQRDKATQRVRDLIKQRNELLKKRQGPDSPEKLASTQAVRRTALENAIADTDRELKTGEKRAKTEAAPDDAHNEQLRAELKAMRDKVKEIDAEQNPGKTEAEKQETSLQKQLDAANAELAGTKEKSSPKEWKALSQKAEDLRAQLDSVRQLKKELEAKPGKTTDDLAAEKAQKGVDAAASALDRWDRILKGEIDRDPAKVHEPKSQLEEDLRSEVDAMRKAADEIRRRENPTDKEKSQLKIIEKSIAEYERRAKAMDFSTKGKMHGPDTEKIAAAKAAKDAAKKVYNDLKKAQQPVKTPEERYNETRLKQIEKRTKELEALRDSGRSSTMKMGPAKPPVQKFAPVRAAEAKLEKAKQDIESKFEKDRLANRTPSQKFWDHFVGVERAMKLSSDVVLAKLSTAAVVREGLLTPIEEAAGGGISKVLPRLAERAPREGGLSLKAEAKAKTEAFTSGMKDAFENLKMKKSELETLYGKKKPSFPSWYEYFGFLHAALKAPIKRAEFARSLQKRIEHAIRTGENVTSIDTMHRLSQEAYLDAERAVFMQDNVISKTFTNALSMAEKNKDFPIAGPAVARIGRFLVPIVKVPTNIVGEVATGVHGLGTGLVRAGAAYTKGIDSLKPEQADAIMRQLKKGLIGNALLLTGYFGYQGIGGFYQKNDKRSPNDVQPDHFRIGSVTLPGFVSHSNGAMLLNLGATFRRADNKGLIAGGVPGAAKGASAAGRGLVKQLPFVPAATNIVEALDSDEGLHKYVRDMALGSVVPAALSHIAKVTDTPGTFPKNALTPATKRYPRTNTDYLKAQVPGYRSQLPTYRQKPHPIPYKRKGP